MVLKELSKGKVQDQIKACIYAMHQGNTETGGLLSQLSDDLIAGWSDELGLTFLHHAAAAGNKEIFNLLLAKFPDLIDRFANNGLTVLHLAFKNPEIVETIIVNRPEFICKEDDLGQSPLSLAEKEGTQSTLHLMIKYLVILLDNSIFDIQTQLNQSGCSSELGDKLGRAQNIMQHLKDLNLVEDNIEDTEVKPSGEVA